MKSAEKSRIRELLSLANINLNGSNPYDIQVLDERFYSSIMANGSLGLGESYMNGWWDVERLDQFFDKILHANLEGTIKPWRFALSYLQYNLVNYQSRTGSRKVAQQHYDLSTKLYESFLDPYNQYTCGYFKDTDDLNEAQKKKLELICRKLQLSSQDRVLDIGCGWGGFAKYAAKHYECHVTGISISREQIQYAKKYTEGLPVDIIEMDYRDIKGEYDKVLICGMIEHVGYKNYKAILEIVHGILSNNGLFLLHTIGGNESVTHTDPWIDKYIFPNSMLPSIKQLSNAFEGLFVMEDWQNLSAHYYKTLMAWYQNFITNWDTIKTDYDEKFFRMWKYYLLCCAGAFSARKNQLWQIVLSKNGVPGGYESVR